MKLSHVALWTHDLDKMTRFWTTMFDAVAGAAYSSERRAGYAHIAIASGSEEAVRNMATKAAALGILASPARLTGDGYFEAVLTDPDGNLVEITV